MRLITPLKVNQELTCHAIYCAVGFGPISALALSIFGVWTLPVGTACLTLPLIVLGLFLVDKSPEASRTAARGFCCGVIAVFLYDLTRWTLSARLGLVDFIPNIGGWLLSSDQPQWIPGYVWRYIGNGGGMGIGFAALVAMLRSLPVSRMDRIDRRALGVLFGIGIWICLLITLLASAHGQEMMFPLTAQYFWVTLIGHVVYGAALGLLIEKRDSQTGRLERLPGPSEGLSNRALSSCDPRWRQMVGGARAETAPPTSTATAMSASPTSSPSSSTGGRVRREACQ